MKFAKLGLVAVVAATVAAVSLTGCGKKNDHVVIKFNSVVTQDTPKGKAMELFKKLVEERSQGKIKVENYHNSVLFKDKEETEALQNGTIQMAATSLAKFGPLGINQFELFDLPFLFNDFNDVHKVTQGPLGQELMKSTASKGILGLSFWDNGMKIMSANKPLKTAEDYKGLKMRIQSSKVLDAQMRSVGALPQVMPFSEVYQALSTGVVDGTENPWSNMWTQKMHEVQKHASVTNHGILGYMVVVNKKFYEGLTPENKAIIDGAVKEATDHANKIAQEENDQALEKIKAAGKTTVYTPTAEERLGLKKAMVASHAEADARVGNGWMKKFYDAVGFDPNK